jgi:hypothetical protein
MPIFVASGIDGMEILHRNKSFLQELGTKEEGKMEENAAAGETVMCSTDASHQEDASAN